MRGLTALERVFLVADVGQPCEEYEAERDEAVIADLLSVERIAKVDAGDEWQYPSTDLGRLALRVCPVE